MGGSAGVDVYAGAKGRVRDVARGPGNPDDGDGAGGE